MKILQVRNRCITKNLWKTTGVQHITVTRIGRVSWKCYKISRLFLNTKNYLFYYSHYFCCFSGLRLYLSNKCLSGISARSWSVWMRGWGKRIWQFMLEETMSLKILTESCTARAQRTWRIDCKSPTRSHFYTSIYTCRFSWLQASLP